MYWLEFGDEDDPFAALEATAAASDVTVLGPGVASARAIHSDRVRQLAFVRRAGELLGRTDATVDGARALLEAASVDRSGSVAVRARDVRATSGVDTQRAERELGRVLVDRGCTVDLEDPDHTLRALFARGPIGRDAAAEPASPRSVDASDRVTLPTDEEGTTDTGAADAARADEGVCVLGWTDAERAGGFGDRAPTDRPFFQPGSMDPRLARALVNVAGARPGATLVDPMCGTGGLLLETALVGGRAVGVDAQAKMVRGTRENLAALAPPDADVAVVRGDARRLPIADGAADAAVVDVPYERQSAVAAADLETLVGDALAALHAVAPRAVVVADRSWAAAARDAGWRVECVHRRRVHRSLVRFVHVLTTDGRADGTGTEGS